MEAFILLVLNYSVKMTVHNLMYARGETMLDNFSAGCLASAQSHEIVENKMPHKITNCHFYPQIH